MTAVTSTSLPCPNAKEGSCFFSSQREQTSLLHPCICCAWGRAQPSLICAFCGLVVQDISQAFRGLDRGLNLQACIAIFAALQLLLSQLPSTHAMKHLTTLATLGMVAFAICVAIQALINGAHPEINVQ